MGPSRTTTCNAHSAHICEADGSESSADAAAGGAGHDLAQRDETASDEECDAILNTPNHPDLVLRGTINATLGGGHRAHHGAMIVLYQALADAALGSGREMRCVDRNIPQTGPCDGSSHTFTRQHLTTLQIPTGYVLRLKRERRL